MTKKNMFKKGLATVGLAAMTMGAANAQEKSVRGETFYPEEMELTKVLVLDVKVDNGYSRILVTDGKDKWQMREKVTSAAELPNVNDILWIYGWDGGVPYIMDNLTMRDAANKYKGPDGTGVVYSADRDEGKTFFVVIDNRGQIYLMKDKNNDELSHVSCGDTLRFCADKNKITLKDNLTHQKKMERFLEQRRVCGR